MSVVSVKSKWRCGMRKVTYLRYVGDCDTYVGGVEVWGEDSQWEGTLYIRFDYIESLDRLAVRVYGLILDGWPVGVAMDGMHVSGYYLFQYLGSEGWVDIEGCDYNEELVLERPDGGGRCRYRVLACSGAPHEVYALGEFEVSFLSDGDKNWVEYNVGDGGVKVYRPKGTDSVDSLTVKLSEAVVDDSMMVESWDE